jgi:hypothetical protein
MKSVLSDRWRVIKCFVMERGAYQLQLKRRKKSSFYILWGEVKNNWAEEFACRL